MKISLEAKEMALLHIIHDMGRTAQHSDNPYCWLNWFCNDEVHNKHPDTFNRCHEKGWLHTTHDGDFEISTTILTQAGTAALTASPARAAEPRMWFVKDFADGWIAFDNEADAKREAEHTGAMMLSGYLTPTT